MLSNTMMERILLAALSKGGDFSEIYIERATGTSLAMINGILEKASAGTDFGIGIRILQGDKCVYVYTNSSQPDKLIAMAQEASASLRDLPSGMSVTLKPREDFHSYQRKPSDIVEGKRKSDMLKLASETAKEYHTSILQTVAGYSESTKEIWIANSDGLYRTDTRAAARFGIEAVASSATEKQSGSFNPGVSGGFSYFENYPVRETAENAARMAVTMLHAKDCPSGKMPVIIENGFGGVIFHEACAHSLEATSVGIGASVFTGKMGQKIAADCVTAIDDGTMPGEWGSLAIDDEGQMTQKNILVDRGILSGYLIDKIGERRMQMPSTGSARRQSYQYAPTSRMTNTYIAPGEHKREDIIRETPYGLYAKYMGGGSVDTATGEFNFSVNEAYMIRDGQIAEPVRGATLIGKGSEILMDIDRVGDNLLLSQGVCGSVSGHVRVCVGQPTIRVKEMTVGGREDMES